MLFLFFSFWVCLLLHYPKRYFLWFYFYVNGLKLSKIYCFECFAVVEFNGLRRGLPLPGDFFGKVLGENSLTPGKFCESGKICRVLPSSFGKTTTLFLNLFFDLSFKKKYSTVVIWLSLSDTAGLTGLLRGLPLFLTLPN